MSLSIALDKEKIWITPVFSRHSDVNGLNFGLVKASINGEEKHGIRVWGHKQGGVEVFLPFYLSPPSSGKSVVFEHYARVTNKTTPAANDVYFWPVILESGTGLHYGYGLAIVLDTSGNLSGIIYWCNGGTSLSSKNITIDWDITAWHKYKIEWTETQMKLYVDDTLKDTEDVSISVPLMPGIEMVIHDDQSTHLNEIFDALFDIYDLIKQYVGTIATV